MRGGAGGGPRDGRLRAVGLIGFVGVAFVAAAVAEAAHGPDIAARYQSSPLPAWAPPHGAFAVVWPALYLLMGLAAWRAWVAAGSLRRAGPGLLLWLLQLGVNALWPRVYFVWGAAGWGVAMIVLLDLLVVATIVAFARWDAVAPTLLAPYLVWLLYLTALTASMWP